MAALAVTEQLGADLGDAVEAEPIVQFAADMGSVETGVETGLSVNLGKRGVDGGDITAMAVEEIESLKTVTCQRHHIVADHRDKGAGPQCDRSGKGQVVLSHAN